MQRLESTISLPRTITHLALVNIDAHRGDGQRFVVRADEKLTAFVELESAIEGVGP